MAFVLIVGQTERFGCGKQIASYPGLVPEEDSKGGRRRLGHISKQGNSLLRFLLVKLRRSRCVAMRGGATVFFHLAKRRGPQDRQSCHGSKTRGFVWTGCGAVDGAVSNWKSFGSHAGQPGNRNGVQ